MSGQGAALGSSLLRVTAHEHSWRWWPPTSTTPPPSDILQPATGSVLICCFIKFRRKERIATCAGGSIILLSDGSAVRTKPGPGSLSRFRRFRTSASGLRSGVSKSFQRGSSWTPPASSLASLGAFRPLPAPRAAGPPGRRRPPSSFRCSGRAAGSGARLSDRLRLRSRHAPMVCIGEGGWQSPFHLRPCSRWWMVLSTMHQRP